MDTPSSIMYADLKAFGRISNRDAAWLLLSPDARSGGIPVRARINNDRTFLSREVVHVRPANAQPAWFGDIAQASLTIAGRIADTLNEANPQQAIANHYHGPAAREMAETLAACGLDATLYNNALAKIAQASLANEHDRAALFLMLFVAAGCLADPSAAISIVEDYAAKKLASGLYTTETSVGPGYAESQRATPSTRLGLLRIVGGMAKPPLRPLSCDPEGTVIGALAAGPNDISDVGRDVSRRHLRIWREQGHWYAQGLESTNGTAVVAGDTRITRVVEPPRRTRIPGTAYPPVEILASDLLCLGETTQFLVMQVVD